MIPRLRNPSERKQKKALLPAENSPTQELPPEDLR